MGKIGRLNMLCILDEKSIVDSSSLESAIDICGHCATVCDSYEKGLLTYRGKYEMSLRDSYDIIVVQNASNYNKLEEDIKNINPVAKVCNLSSRIVNASDIIRVAVVNYSKLS